jgi:hypothetical protein
VTGAQRTLAVVTFGVLSLVLAGPASAHPAQFGSLVVRERAEPGLFAYRLEYSGDEQAPRGASIAWPAGCATPASAGSPRRIERPFGETQLGSVRCTDEGLEGRARLEGLPPGVQVAVRVERREGAVPQSLVHAGAPEFVLAEARAASAETFARYLALGVEHIALGLDHLLFVAVLVVLHRRDPTRRGALRLLGTLTAFTLGHSVTLALSVLDLVRVPQAPVEACIALSIVLVAAESARAEREERGQRATLTRERPWLVAGLFGLVHGLGFAGALREAGLEGSSVGLALAGFNVGVELGQVLFVAAVVAALAAARRAGQLARASCALAYVAGALAVAWSLERLAALGG